MSMRTTARKGSRSGLAPAEFGIVGLESRSAGEERSEPAARATRGAGGTLRASAAADGRTELVPGLVDDAVNRARVRSAVGPLPGGGRIADEVLDPLLAGARTEDDIAGSGGLLAQLTKRWWSGRWRS